MGDERAALAAEAYVYGYPLGFTVRPLDPAAARRGLPTPDPTVPAELAFFERLRVFMSAFPPAAADRAYQERFEPLGLLDAGESPYADAPADLAAALQDGLAAGKQRVEQASRSGSGEPVDGWTVAPHLFDYNVDFLGPGTIDSPRWKMPDRAAAYLARAVAARVGLWGNHGYEAVYAMAFTDDTGAALNGAGSYTLTFAEPPPVDAFWSLTMYDTPDYYLVPNPIDRYSVGDRTAGLRYADDGSLTVVMRRDRPAADEVPNWLPTPAGDFRPILRLYQPRPAILDGSYVLPPVTRR